MRRLAVAAAATFAPVVLAVTTSFWVVSTQEEFLKGKCKGVAVSSEGRLTPGIQVAKIELKADAVWTLHPRPGGNYLLGTGNKGKVFLYDGTNLKEAADTGTLAVTAFADDGNGLILAGTIPDGRVFRLMPQEGGTYKVELFAKVPASYIWSLAYNRKDGCFYAATGPEGEIYQITTEAAVTLWLDTKETHFLSLTCDADGSLYAGSAPRGLVLEILAKNKVQVLYDCAEEEVWRLALTADGIIACANKGKGGENSPPAQGKEAPEAQGGSLPTHGPTAFSIYRVRKDGGAERVFGQQGAFAWQAAADGMGRILVATGDKGRVFRVEPDGSTYETLLELESKAVAAIALAAGEPVLFAANDPAALFRAEEQKKEGEYTSPVLDAGFTASWGKASLRGLGQVNLQARTGQTSEVDDTWSDWSAAVDLNGGPVLCPRARYLQFKLTLSGTETYLDEVRIPFLVDNQRPEITDFQVQRATQKAGPGGQPKQAQKDVEGATVERLAPQQPSPQFALQWQVRDADEDPLISRLYFRFPKTLAWMPIGREDEPLREPKFTWDTTGLPEGRYALKLIVSDEENNPPGNALSATKIIEPIVVDNTPPEVLNLRIEGKMLLASASDATSRITRMTFQVDGKRPRLIFPADGVFDENSEAVRLDIAASVEPGEHIIAVYAEDAEGNTGSASMVAVIGP